MKIDLHRKLLTHTLFIAILFMGGCKEDIGITVNKIGQKPPVITNTQVTSVSGGAYIKYDLPLSEDLRYVKATYKLDNGIIRESKASIYKNEIFVNGFGEEGIYDIELKSVAVGEVESDPLVLKVKVLTPPYKLVRVHLKLSHLDMCRKYKLLDSYSPLPWERGWG